MTKDNRFLRECPVCCSGQNQKLFYNQQTPIAAYDMSYDVVCCQECGFVFASNMAPEELYKEYYENLSKYDVIERAEQVPVVDRQRAIAAVSMCSEYLGHDSTVADLGCGVGILLDSFKAAGWESLYGLDPAPNAGKCAKALFGLENVMSGTLCSVQYKLSEIDLNLVCLTGVLEHLTSPRKEMSELIKWLAPNTLILIEVPALERFNVEPNEPNGEFSIEHLQFFSKTSLSNFMRSIGTEVVALDYLDLAPAATDSLIGLFRVCETSDVSNQSLPKASEDKVIVHDYIARSELKLKKAIRRIKAIEGSWILYGAGSHTTRLMPILNDLNLVDQIQSIVDGNRNLHGQYLGAKKILSPDNLADQPQLPVVISSFRSQRAIAKIVSDKFANQVITLY